MVADTPLLNRVSIGIKNRGLELPGEANCNFIGYSNASASNGTSLGFVNDTILLSTSDTISYNVNLTPTGVSGYNITSTPITIPLSTPFNASGVFYSLPAGQNVVFNGKTAQIAFPLGNAQSQVVLSAEPPVNILNADRFGVAKSLQVSPSASLGAVRSTISSQFTSSTNVSQCLTFPASFVMQGSTNYASVVVMDFKCTNRGQSSQIVSVGYQIIPNIGDTSVHNLEALMTSYVPILQSANFSYNTTMPTCLFVRWPFQTTRLRIHSIAAKRF